MLFLEVIWQRSCERYKTPHCKIIYSRDGNSVSPYHETHVPHFFFTVHFGNAYRGNIQMDLLSKEVHLFSWVVYESERNNAVFGHIG